MPRPGRDALWRVWLIVAAAAGAAVSWRLNPPASWVTSLGDTSSRAAVGGIVFAALVVVYYLAMKVPDSLRAGPVGIQQGAESGLRQIPGVPQGAVTVVNEVAGLSRDTLGFVAEVLAAQRETRTAVERMSREFEKRYAELEGRIYKLASGGGNLG